MNTRKELENRNWKDDDKIFVITTKFKNNVLIPDSIEEAHFLDNPGYYTYIYDEVFLTMEDARKGFIDQCLRTRKTIKRKTLTELKKIDIINEYIEKLKETELEVKAKAVEYTNN